MATDLFEMPGHLIRRLHQRATRLFHDRLKAAGHDLTPVQFAAMQVLQDHPEIDQARLAHRIAYDRATIGGVVERLERRGLVTRRAHATDRRCRLVSLTPQGAAVLADLQPLVRDLQRGILENLSDDEAATALALMRKSLAMEAGAD